MCKLRNKITEYQANVIEFLSSSRLRGVSDSIIVLHEGRMRVLYTAWCRPVGSVNVCTSVMGAANPTEVTNQDLG